MNDASSGPAHTVGFEILGDELSTDVEASLRLGIDERVVFSSAPDPLAIFRKTLEVSIRGVESHPRGRLFQRFLRDGPYEDVGPIPPDLADKRLDDDETAGAVTFIYAFMVNSFKGNMAELLAVAPCVEILKRLQLTGALSPNARLYLGDSVAAGFPNRPGTGKGADLHILVSDEDQSLPKSITVAGVVEVKSFVCSQPRLRRQLDRHLMRVSRVLRVNCPEGDSRNVSTAPSENSRRVKIGVVPASWKLPREFRFETRDDRRKLLVDAGSPPNDEDLIVHTAPDEWRVTLRWSQEALAAAAYEMTFWYMEKVGEAIYSEGVPESWSDMSPAEAGRNAVKMALYYAILRARSRREPGWEYRRAVALYNTYGFGYALGMNFRRRDGTRDMLWPEDLDEIAASGHTKSGSYIR